MFTTCYAAPMSDRRVAFGRWLHSQLEHRNWSARAFALQIGVHPGTVNRWVNGERLPDWDSLPKIADGLGLPVEFVWTEFGIPVDPEALDRAARRHALTVAYGSEHSFQDVLSDAIREGVEEIMRRQMMAGTWSQQLMPVSGEESLADRFRDPSVRAFMMSHGVTESEWDRIMAVLSAIPAKEDDENGVDC